MGSEINLTQNLSETLFKPRRQGLETSLISNSGCPLPELLPQAQAIFGFNEHWYRPLNRFYWTWLGGNLLDIEEALSHIASSQNSRTRPTCLDTVEEYGPGNWIYEFNTIAQKRVQQAGECEDNERKAHHYRMASRYFAIAAYPYLKGDTLAQQAALLCRRYYRAIFEASTTCGYYSEETFTFQGHKITAYLHSPDNTAVHPCVLVLGSYEQSCTDFFRFFNDYLRPRGIAIMVLEMPGQGNCASLKLEPQSSDYLKSAIEHLQALPFIDGTNLGFYARGVAALAAMRLCLLEPQLIKAAVLVNPLIDRLYMDEQALLSIPLCLRSSFANRLDLDASHWDTLIPQAQILSLKKQGLLTGAVRAKPAILCLDAREMKLSSEDVKLIERSFKDVTTLAISSGGFNAGSLTMLNEVCKFFVKHFII